MQVDTCCHKIPNFIEKAARAGCTKVFIGLENINPDNLKGASKGQNQITEYRAMLQAWRRARVLTFAGYILGFPDDTPASIERDIGIIQRELPIDMLEFFILTPLPGSEDHQELARKGVPMDPDMNRYDIEHVTTAHPHMSAEEWTAIYRRAWHLYYSPAHIETLLRRAVANGGSARRVAEMTFYFYATAAFEGVHPLQGGLLRRKSRRQRRPGLPREHRLRLCRPPSARHPGHLRADAAPVLEDRPPAPARAARSAEPDSTPTSPSRPVDGSAELELYETSDSARQAAARAKLRMESRRAAEDGRLRLSSQRA